MEHPTRLDRPQRALRVTQIVLVLSILALVPLLFLTAANKAPQLYVLCAFFSALLLTAALCLYWVRNGHHTRGVASLLATLILTLVAMPLLFDGTGVLMGLLTIFVVWQIANMTLTPTRAGQAMLIGLLGGIVAVLLDLPELGTQMPLRDLNVLFGTLSFVIIFAFGVLILRHYRQYSVRTKVLSVTLFITLLIVSTTTVLTGEAIRRTLKEEAGDDLQLLAQSRAFAVSEMLRRQTSILQVLGLDQRLQAAAVAQGDEVKGGETAVLTALSEQDAQWQAAADHDPLVADKLNNEAATTLRKFQEQFSFHHELFLTDRYGGLVAATQRTTDYYQGDEAWWQSAFANGVGKAYISEPIWDESSNTFGLQIAIPVYAEGDGELVGVLRSTYALTELQELLDEGLRADTSVTMALLINDQELPMEGEMGSLQPTQLDGEILAQLQTTNDVLLKPYDGTLQFMSAARVRAFFPTELTSEQGWLVLLLQPQKEALRPLGVQQRLNTLLGVLLAVVGGLIAAYAGNVLSQPIGLLTQTAVRVRNGDFEAQATVDSTDEIGTLAETFNAMTLQLRANLQNLEFRVRERTRGLEVAAQIGRRISTILDEDEMITAVVDQVQKAFNYYHVQIYLLDKTTNRLTAASGTGQPGRSMRQYGHYVTLGEGLVGQAAANNLPLLAPDVTREHRWLPNKWLPETRSELAVPIATEKEVLGVLDVQRTSMGSLTEADTNVLQLIANQVAIALQNARQYVVTQQRAERQLLINKIGQQIQSTTAIDEALQVAVRELGRALGSDYTRVHLTNEIGPDK